MDKYKKISLTYLHLKIAWLRFKIFRVEMSKSNFLIYTIFILLIGLGLGMFWHSYQVESDLKAQIIFLKKSRSEWARAHD